MEHFGLLLAAISLYSIYFIPTTKLVNDSLKNLCAKIRALLFNIQQRPLYFRLYPFVKIG